jgi:chloramphenicol 3-O-phosphotransferase
VARVIYLNGTSSAGKSTIARALHDQLDDLYLDVPLDVFLWMVPPHGWEREGGAVMTPPQEGHGLNSVRCARGSLRDSIAPSVR